jgi:hypothetical protein
MSHWPSVPSLVVFRYKQLLVGSVEILILLGTAAVGLNSLRWSNRL